ncbi:MAG TPA: thioredoxin family protein [Polyangia bacterium]
MRRLAIVTFSMLGLILAVAPGLATEQKGIGWQSGTLAQALAQAKASGRWVLVDVYATWCGPCHAMDEQVWSREDVAHALDEAHGGPYLPLRRDGESGEGIEVARRYHVVGYPTLLVLDGSGAEIDRVMGFVEPKELVATLAAFRAGKGTLVELERSLKATPNGAARDALLFEVGSRHAMRGDSRAVAELTEVAKQDSKRAAPALLTLGKYYYLRGQKDYPSAIATLRELERRFPSSEEAGEAPYDLGAAFHALGKDSEARAVLDRWIAAAPKDGERYNAYAWLSYKSGFDRPRGIEVASAGLKMDPKNDSLWDTLAELYAATGKPTQAREAAARALALKPGDHYYQAQLRRFGGAR